MENPNNMGDYEMRKVLVYFCLLFSSCTSSFEERMMSCLERHIEDSDSVFNMKELYTDWDYMYIILESASYDDVVKILGHTNYLHDSSCDIVFEKDGRIVKYVQLFPYEGWPNESIISIRFDFASDSCYKKFNANEAIFKIERYWNAYILSPN